MTMLLTGTRWRKWLRVSILPTGSTDASVVIWWVYVLVGLVIAHAANMSSTILQNVVRVYLVCAWSIWRWTVGTPWNRLIFQPQISNFGEHSLLSAQGKLLMGEHCVLLNLSRVLHSSRMVSLPLILLLGSVIPADVTLSFALISYEHPYLLRLLLSTLSSHAMIVLLVLNSDLSGLDGVTLHVWTRTVGIGAVAMALPPTLVLS